MPAPRQEGTASGRSDAMSSAQLAVPHRWQSRTAGKRAQLAGALLGVGLTTILPVHVNSDRNVVGCRLD